MNHMGYSAVLVQSDASLKNVLIQLDSEAIAPLHECLASEDT